jgi:DNA primase
LTERIRAGRRAVEITHAARVVFRRAGLTKLDLARHYERVGPAMIPHVRDRPPALDAYPEGVQGGGYLIKQIPRHFPDWIARATVRKRGGEVTHVLANDRATLVYLAGQNAVTLHAWPSRADQRKADRGKRIFVDVNRNGYAQHTVAVYAVRPRAAAPVAAPLHWDELEDRRLAPGRWNVTTIGDRLDAEGDPWKAIGSHARALGPAIRRTERAQRGLGQVRSGYTPGTMSEEEEERTDTSPPPREEADHSEEPARKQSDQLPEERPASEREDSDDEADAPSS